MARKPPDWRQPSLFPPDPATSAGQAPPNTPEPQDNITQESNGDQHALQDHSPRTPATTAGDARPSAEGTQAADNDGVLRQGAEGEPRSLEGNSRPTEAGQRPEPDQERGAGALKEMENRLPSASETGEEEAISLDEAMAYLRNHTSRG